MGLDGTDLEPQQQDDPAQGTGGTDQGQQPAPQADAATDQQQPLEGRKPAWTAADTQNAQQLSALRQELGLPKNASVAKVREAINALRQPTQQTDWDSLDPEVRAAFEQRDTELWEMSQQVYGEQFVEGAKSLQEVAAQATPSQWSKALYDWVMSATEAPGESDDGSDQLSGEPQMPELGNADVPVTQRTTSSDPTGGRRDTGDLLGWVKGLGIRGQNQPAEPPR